jgi:hypothetical protein
VRGAHVPPMTSRMRVANADRSRQDAAGTVPARAAAGGDTSTAGESDKPCWAVRRCSSGPSLQAAVLMVSGHMPSLARLNIALPLAPRYIRHPAALTPCSEQMCEPSLYASQHRSPPPIEACFRDIAGGHVPCSNLWASCVPCSPTPSVVDGGSAGRAVRRRTGSLCVTQAGAGIDQLPNYGVLARGVDTDAGEIYFLYRGVRVRS